MINNFCVPVICRNNGVSDNQDPMDPNIFSVLSSKKGRICAIYEFRCNKLSECNRHKFLLCEGFVYYSCEIIPKKNGDTKKFSCGSPYLLIVPRHACPKIGLLANTQNPGPLVATFCGEDGVFGAAHGQTCIYQPPFGVDASAL